MKNKSKKRNSEEEEGQWIRVCGSGHPLPMLYNTVLREEEKRRRENRRENMREERREREKEKKKRKWEGKEKVPSIVTGCVWKLLNFNFRSLLSAF